MTENELYDELTSSVDSVEYTGGTPQISRGVGVGISRVKGNPLFVSQFDLNVTIKYYSLTFGRTTTDDTWTCTLASVAPGSLPGNLQNDLAVFLFGKADSMGGYKRNNQLFPVSNWAFKKSMLIEDTSPLYDFKLNVSATDCASTSVISPSFLNGQVSRGDMVQSYTYLSASSSTTATYYLAEIRVECKQVAYGTLLDATSSDRFTMNNIRYKVPDSTKTAQFEKQLRIIRQSLFGKLSTDDISPAAYQKPEQYQTNIIDVPIIKGIDKESSLGSYLNYDVGEILLSIFVQTQTKVTEKVG